VPAAGHPGLGKADVTLGEDLVENVFVVGIQVRHAGAAPDATRQTARQIHINGAAFEAVEQAEDQTGSTLEAGSLPGNAAD
jgi:hypothetical protein